MSDAAVIAEGHALEQPVAENPQPLRPHAGLCFQEISCAGLAPDIDDREHGEMQSLLSHVPAPKDLLPAQEYGFRNFSEDHRRRERFS